jgi:hypothetical protein
MVIIATNNGHIYLEKLLQDFLFFFSEKNICVIDTGSDNEETLLFLSKLKKKEIFSILNIKVMETPYKGYDSGAYIYAMKNIISDKYYFLHDSISIKNKNFFNDIDEKLDDDTVVSIINFPSNFFDNQSQIDFCIKTIGTCDFDDGIFGPMFSINKSAVNKIINDLDFYPTNKNEQMSMERVWPSLFKKKNIKIVVLDGSHNLQIFANNGYKYINKTFLNRQ